MPRSLRYNLKTIDQSYSELKKKTMQLEFMMNGIDDEEFEPERVSRNSCRNKREIGNAPNYDEQDDEKVEFILINNYLYFFSLDFFPRWSMLWAASKEVIRTNHLIICIKEMEDRLFFNNR